MVSCLIEICTELGIFFISLLGCLWGRCKYSTNKLRPEFWFGPTPRHNEPRPGDVFFLVHSNLFPSVLTMVLKHCKGGSIMELYDHQNTSLPQTNSLTKLPPSFSHFRDSFEKLGNHTTFLLIKSSPNPAIDFFLGIMIYKLVQDCLEH